MTLVDTSDITAEFLLGLLRDSGLEADIDGGRARLRSPHFDLFLTPGPWLRAEAVWVGELSARDYVRTTVALNSAQRGTAPRMLIDAPAAAAGGLVSVLKADSGELEARARVVYPLGAGATRAQLTSFIAVACEAGIALTREFHALYPERSPRVRGQRFTVAVAEAEAAEKISVARVAGWFLDQGVSEVPYDEDTGSIGFELGDVPVDIILSEPDWLSIIAAVPLPPGRNLEATETLHLCNRANIDSELSGIIMHTEADEVRFVSRVSVPVRAGLNDSQLAQALTDGVGGAVAQVQAVLHQLH